MYTKKSRNDLKTQLDNLVNDNAAQEISAQDVRTVIGDALESMDHLDEGARDRTSDTNIKLDHNKGNQYNMTVAARTGNITIDPTDILRNADAVLKHNDSTVPTITISGSTNGSLTYPDTGVTQLTDFYSVSNDNYIRFVCIDDTPDNEIIAVMPFSGGTSSGGGLSGPSTATLPITFSNREGNVYGLPSAPLTGALTLDATGAVNGGKALVWYQDTSDPFDPIPSLSGHSVRMYGGQDFGSGILMLYEFYYQFEGTTPVVVVKTQRANTSAPTISNVVFNGTVQVGETLTADCDFDQAEGLPADHSATILEIWLADTAGELTQQQIETGPSGSRVLHASQTGNLQWTPQATEETKYIMIRKRMYSTDSAAPGSDWGYSVVLGPIAAASSTSPLDTSATKLWYDWANNDGGAVGGQANHWETVYNKADGTGETDYSQTTHANQASVLNQATNNSTEFDSNDRYQAGSWTLTPDLFDAGDERTYYFQVKLPDGQGLTRLAYLTNNQSLYFDTTNYFIQGHAGTFKTADNAIQADVWTTIKIHTDGTTAEITILDGAGVGAGSGPVTTSTFSGKIGPVNTDYDINNQASGVEWRHNTIEDDTITAQETIDLEAWFTTQAAL